MKEEDGEPQEDRRIADRQSEPRETKHPAKQAKERARRKGAICHLEKEKPHKNRRSGQENMNCITE